MVHYHSIVKTVNVVVTGQQRIPRRPCLVCIQCVLTRCRVCQALSSLARNVIWPRQRSSHRRRSY